MRAFRRHIVTLVVLGGGCPVGCVAQRCTRSIQSEKTVCKLQTVFRTRRVRVFRRPLPCFPTAASACVVLGRHTLHNGGGRLKKRDVAFSDGLCVCGETSQKHPFGTVCITGRVCRPKTTHAPPPRKSCLNICANGVSDAPNLFFRRPGLSVV
ncbi:hypothetical protein [Kingella potus]|uniref:hypothetical protein n=1 Tax=Kingella potus TaxID=265175 RepID=UPI001FD42012|nr:hypothetical protein [Kingella potus]UOP00138.1 hypothetical protein LVJ84_09285 [Kingella potus]